MIESGVRIKKSCVFPDTVICEHSLISQSIIGRECYIGKWARIEKMAVLAEDVRVDDEVFINGSQILPHKEIKDNHYEHGEIIM